MCHEEMHYLKPEAVFLASGRLPHRSLCWLRSPPSIGSHPRRPLSRRFVLHHHQWLRWLALRPMVPGFCVDMFRKTNNKQYNHILGMTSEVFPEGTINHQCIVFFFSMLEA